MSRNTKRAIKIGKVSKVLTNSTLIATISKKSPHPIYHKVIQIHKNYLVKYDNKSSQIKIGDDITIASCRPMSSNIRWRMV